MIIVPVEKKIDWRRPPVVLITLVLLNILIFAFYQSGDGELFDKAVDRYERNNLIDLEWRAYQKYVANEGRELDFDKDDDYASFYIIVDTGFDQYMSNQGAQYIPRSQRDDWRLQRNEVEQLSSKVSSTAFGFHANDINIIQLFSSQFLHGDAMHLFGNMVFLILVGFAAEAALGSGIFLLFYLLSGAAGALLYAALAPGYGVLIGASGSISGVMAMYVVLFGLRKIQFFYWVFVLTGYFRAAAIIMLPFYILKEVHSYITLEGSNVAFTAHIGGFLAGAALVAATKLYRSETIDEDYLDNKPEPVNQFDLDLQKAYDAMGQCEFSRAWQLLKPIKKENPKKPAVIDLEYNLIRALHPSKRKDYLIHRLDKLGNSNAILSDQFRLWKQLTSQEREELNAVKRQKLFTDSLQRQQFDVAEQLFSGFKNTIDDPKDLAIMARQFSVACRENRRESKADEYDQLAQQLMSSI